MSFWFVGESLLNLFCSLHNSGTLGTLAGLAGRNPNLLPTLFNTLSAVNSPQRVVSGGMEVSSTISLMLSLLFVAFYIVKQQRF